ncbi:hypothetical protein AMJ48_02210 [Parcubacteria bacterium DG_74_1]|nr:MAG: hypothetical protein AMJ48_02210 [Parcubacteria bacterium DG_74_1]
MKKYEVLEHKADLKIRAFGKTKEELFQNMLLGMSESQKPEIKDNKKTERKIKIKSLNPLSLLVDFLSEILYFNQINKEIYSNVDFIRFTDTELEARLAGRKVERLGEDIKAVTYHNLDVHQKKDKTWEAIVLFDV